ncbi:nuclear transport factor 2 family protein [Simiduia agarivorans]|uniref:Ketosteroid isomerase-like protein, cystatin fold protein n=1 Tax=Simiduia agarivorans (strain DSM 21679 / JCM 13881 / BCRC 17597 / SA1) TaxID=1117647 RepID=K4KI25_SIMAS|nr:nuclear transport factor 2 family protein [Simiduia agarivorans]AFU98779.1 ketosteroid isomerase-like protein, cystatin fold protein [Simiduia agarivorans SA1 = DSM 21679]
MQAKCQTLMAFYRSFDTSTWRQARSVYHPQAVFIDPIHRIEGLESIESYFRQMSENLISCQFEFTHSMEQGDEAFLRWVMRYRHPRLRGGAEIAMPGISRLRFSGDKVIEHEDCYDMGAMVYEHVPLIGRVVRWLRTRLADDAPESAVAPVQPS